MSCEDMCFQKKQLQVFNCICFSAKHIFPWCVIHLTDLCWYKKNLRYSKRGGKKLYFLSHITKICISIYYYLTQAVEYFPLTQKRFSLLQSTLPNRMYFGEDNNCHFKVIIYISIPVPSM